jgi:hypothetical protein
LNRTIEAASTRSALQLSDMNSLSNGARRSRRFNVSIGEVLKMRTPLIIVRRSGVNAALRVVGLPKPFGAGSVIRRALRQSSFRWITV